MVLAACSPCQPPLCEAQALILDGNLFAAWADVAECATLPGLQRLSLSDNRLADLQSPQPGKHGSRMPALSGKHIMHDTCNVGSTERVQPPDAFPQGRQGQHCMPGVLPSRLTGCGI